MATEKDSSIEVLKKIKAEIAAVDARVLEEMNSPPGWYGQNRELLMCFLAVGLIVVGVALSFAFHK